MPLIKNRALVEDSWTHVADGEPLPDSGDVIVSLERWREQREQLAHRGQGMGVRLSSSQLAQEVAPLLDGLSLVAIEFPRFTDGRGYTTARLLRERYGFRGEIRAVGHVLRDQLFYMARVGMDAFELAPGKDAIGALEAFEEFSFSYQAAADDPRPLYRRGLRG